VRLQAAADDPLFHELIKAGSTAFLDAFLHDSPTRSSGFPAARSPSRLVCEVLRYAQDDPDFEPHGKESAFI
jgi:hypothetical protein